MDPRQRLLDAAARLFAEVGFRGATTRRIAQEADVSEVTLFRHFGSKEQLLMQACAAVEEVPARDLLPEAPRRPRTELLTWARAVLARLRDRRSFIRTCLAEAEEHPEMIPPRNQSVRTTMELRAYLEALQRRGLASRSFDPAVAGPMLVGVLFADAMVRDVIPEIYENDPDDAVAAYVDLFLRGIGVGGRAASRRPRMAER